MNKNYVIGYEEYKRWCYEKNVLPLDKIYLYSSTYPVIFIDEIKYKHKVGFLENSIDEIFQLLSNNSDYITKDSVLKHKTILGCVNLNKLCDIFNILNIEKIDKEKFYEMFKKYFSNAANCHTM